MSRNSYFGYLTSLPAGNGVMEKQLSWVFFFFSPMSFANQTSWKLCAPQASQQMLARMKRSSLNELFVKQAVVEQRSKILFLTKFSHFNTCWCKNGKPRTRLCQPANCLQMRQVRRTTTGQGRCGVRPPNGTASGSGDVRLLGGRR